MKVFLVSAALVAVASVAVAAECGPHADVMDQLLNRHGEGVIGMGLDRKGMIGELAVNPDTGSWSMVYTTPDGTACIVGAGMGWETVTPEIAGQDS